MNVIAKPLTEKIAAARRQLDAQVREMVQWHFDPATGCPFWLDYAGRLDFDPRKEIGGFSDLKLLGHFQDEWLRGGPVRKWVPKGLAGKPVYVFETGGSTGVPKTRININDFQTDYELFSKTLSEKTFPKGADWLMLGPSGPRRLRLAVERKRLDLAARKAYATDLATGLPNHAQLLEHMTHLLALREREPAPMALIVLRIEGLAGTEAALGAEAANVLRRKVAVRIRAGLRASDVVASLGSDSFAVLLAWIDAPDDAVHVASKLAQQVRQPYNVAGTDRAVAVALGLAAYPEHGRDAESLLRRATSQAASVATVGREGFATRVERGPAAAANDD